MCTCNLTKQEDWKIPCYTFGKELRKNLAINEESFKYLVSNFYGIFTYY